MITVERSIAVIIFDDVHLIDVAGPAGYPVNANPDSASISPTVAIALKLANGKLVFALSPSLSGDVARPASGIRAVVSPMAFCELWPPAMAGRVSDDDKIVVLKRAVSMSCFIWKASSKGVIRRNRPCGFFVTAI